jgi:beta-glucosidase
MRRLILVPLCTVVALDAQVEERVSALLARMTLEEKIGQLTQMFFRFVPDTAKPQERIRKGQAGSYLFVTEPAIINRLQHVAVEESRMHIPLLIGFDRQARPGR